MKRYDLIVYSMSSVHQILNSTTTTSPTSTTSTTLITTATTTTTSTTTSTSGIAIVTAIKSPARRAFTYLLLL